jgi:co-chaperonin GroES (HSP10)
MKIRNGNVLIKLQEEKRVTDGGIYIPETGTLHSRNIRKGTVIESGPGEHIYGHFVQNDIKKGDEVLFDFSRAQIVKTDAEYWVCNQVDVLAII